MTPEQFLQLADLYPEPSLLLTTGGAILAVNRAAAALGLNPQRSVGRPLADVVATPAEVVREYLRLCSGSREPIIGSLNLLTESEGEVPCRCHGCVVPHEPQGAQTRLLLRLDRRESGAGPVADLARQIDQLTEEIHRRQRAEAELREVAGRHRAMEEHLTALVEASSALAGALELPAVLEAILKVSGRLLPADAHAVWRYHARAGRWLIAASAGLSEKYQRETVRALEQAPGMPRTPIVAEDVMELPMLSGRKEMYRAEGIRSMLVVPLSIHGQVRGTLAFYHRRPHPFEDVEVRTATAVANLAAAAIGSADLYEQAQDHEERLRVTLASIGDAVIATDVKGRVQFLNPVAEALTGWTQKEAEGQPLEMIFRIVNEHTRRPVDNPVLEVLREGAVVGVANHTVLIARDGTERPIADSAAPIKDRWGDVGGVVLIFRDVTEERRIESALRRQADLLEQAHEAVFVWEFPGPIVYWNQGSEHLYGFSRQEAIGKISYHLLSTAFPHGSAELEETLARQGEYTGELTQTKKGGERIVVESRIRLITEPDGRRLALETNRDVTRRKRAEQDARFLAEASATLAGLVDYESTLQKIARLAVPFFADWCTVDMLDDAGALRRLAVAHVDPSKVELAHELQRRYPPDPNSPGTAWEVLRTGRPRLTPHITEELIAERIKDEELRRILRELGLRSSMMVPLNLRGKAIGLLTFIAAESGRHYDETALLVAEDLAHRAAVAIENARLYQALREADRRKDEFLALLGHELRNPLAPIRNALHVLRMPGANEAITRRAREMMERQVEHMVRLVDDLLDVSRIMRGKVELRLEPVDLATVVARAVETSQAGIDAEGHELTVALPSEPLWIHGDPVRLAQVVSNLLQNAAKYTERGGQIVLAVAPQGDEAVLSVRDTGIGIAPELLPRLFDMFFQGERRTRDAQGGLGIGLSLVRGLVELHGGKVEAHSAGPRKGSEFVVRLPLRPKREKEGVAPEGSAAGSGGKYPPRKVLVVDDNVDAADSLAMLLRLEGQQVQVAYEGSTALERAAAEPPDLAFLDLGMPKMDGCELARAFRAHPALRGTVLVALTGWGQSEDRRRTKEAGFDHHLVKPVEAEELRRLLEERA